MANIIQSPENLQGPGIQVVYCTVTPNDTVAPDGTTTADRITKTATNNLPMFIFPQYGKPPGSRWSFSCFTKNGLHFDTLNIGPNSSPGVEAGWRFPPIAQYFNVNLVWSGYKEYPNGWTRWGMEWTLDVTWADNLYLEVGDARTIGDYAWVWGMMLEAGPIANYISQASWNSGPFVNLCSTGFNSYLRREVKRCL